MPVCASKAAEGGNKSGEDADKDHVSAKGTDHVDEAENAHPELEESCEEEIGSASDVGHGDAEGGLPKLALNAGLFVPTS